MASSNQNQPLVPVQTPYDELRAELIRQRAEIVDQRAIIEELRNHSNSRRPRPSLPHPERFNGHIQKWDTWFPSIKAKVHVDGDAIGDDTAKFYYVFFNLESSVQALVLPQLDYADAQNEWDYTTILTQLERIYYNPTKAEDAEEKLSEVRQGTNSLPVYVAAFERTLYEAKALDWPDATKISQFKKGLNSTLSNRLRMQLGLPRKYNDFVTVVQKLAGRSTFNSSSHGTPYNAPTKPSFPQPDRRHSTAKAYDARLASQDSMDLSTLELEVGAINLQPGAVAPSTTIAQRQILRREGRCVRCRSNDHWVDHCPVRSFSPPRTGSASRSKGPHFEEPKALFDPKTGDFVRMNAIDGYEYEDDAARSQYSEDVDFNPTLEEWDDLAQRYGMGSSGKLG